MEAIFNRDIKGLLRERLEKLEQHFGGDVVFYHGDITPNMVNVFRDFIEELKIDNGNKKLFFIVKTSGGSVETVEKMVHIIRSYYEEVNFIVPDYAMSAGTILCMSGDSIHLDYSANLGPIDPQVWNGKNWVPALGYLDKVEELIKKANNKTISEAEFLILKDQDLATLRQYEQHKELSISLLKEWLVKYKFKNWSKHASTGIKVTEDDKINRAEKIAKDLSSNKLWHSHSRPISIDALRNKLNLKIDCFDDVNDRKKIIRDYNDMICEYFRTIGITTFLHSRKYL